MANQAMRTDREAMNALEKRVMEIALYQLADLFDGLVRKGAIYGQLILPPEESELKRQAMEARNGISA